MAYTPKTWTTGETITAAELTAIEAGVQAAAATADTANSGLGGKVNSSTYTAGLASKADFPAGGTDGQALVKAGTTTAWATVSSAARAVFDPASYGAAYNGTTDDHAAVQAAIDACSAAGGGTVTVTGNVKNNTTLTLKSGVILDLGKWTLNGSASPQIGMPTSGSPDRMGIRGGFISGPGDGISLSITTGSYQLGWPRITVENVTLVDCGGRGVYSFGTTIEARFINVVALRSAGYGFEIDTTDTMLIGCTAASGQSAGFQIAGGNSKLTNCKAYGNTGSGFVIAGAGRHLLSACEAQDNQQEGFNIGGAWNTLTACLADSNGTVAFDVYGNENTLTAVAAMYGGGGSGQVTPTGFRMAGNGNVVTGTSGCTTTVTSDSGTNVLEIIAQSGPNVIAGLGTGGGGSGVGTNAADVGYDVVLLLGQSNMQGSALDATGDARLLPTNPRVLTWDAGGTYGEQITVSPGLGLYHQGGAGTLGPGHTFGLEYAGMIPTNRRVLLVPAAYNGTSFTSAGGGTGNVWDSDGTNNLYTGAIALARHALGSHPNNRMAAILWHQGESNAGMAQATYAAKLDALIAKARSDLSAPNLPFIVGGLVPEWVAEDIAGRQPIVNALAATPSRTAHTAYVNAPQGAFNSGGGGNEIHFNAAGQRVFGVGYAQVLSYAQANGNPASPPTIPAPGAVTGLGTSAITQTGATVSWTPVPGAWNYRVEHSKSGVNTWTVDGYAFSLPFMLSGLTAGTAYDIRVTPYGWGGAGTAQTVTFTTSAAAGPATGSDSTSFAGNDGLGLPVTDQGRTWATAVAGATATAQFGTATNQARLMNPTAGNWSIAFVDVGAADVTVQATLSTINSSGGIGVVLGFVDSNNYIFASQGNLFQVVGGTQTLVTGYSASALASGDVLKVKRAGSAITVYKNGTSIATGTVSDAGLLAATKHGFTFYAVDTSSRLDDWSVTSP